MEEKETVKETVKVAASPKKKGETLGAKSLIMMGLALLSFIFLFVAWIRVSVYFYSQSFSIFTKGMFELSFFLGLAKIIGILSIIAFCVYIISQFVDFKTLVPALKDVDFKKWAPIAYFGSYAVALVLALLGIIVTEYVGIGFGWFLGLVFAGAGLLFTFKPEFLNRILKSIKK